MYQPNQSVTIVSAPAAYPLAPGLAGRINSVTTDPVSGATVYSVITTERVGTQPYVGGRGGDLYECHGLDEADLRPTPPSIEAAKDPEPGDIESDARGWYYRDRQLYRRGPHATRRAAYDASMEDIGEAATEPAE